MIGQMGRWCYVAVSGFLACGLVFLLSGCGGNGISGPLAKVCVKGPSAVAVGPAGSVYVQDNRGISRYSTKGKLLDRFGSGRADFAVSPTGNVYYLQGSSIVGISPSGKTAASWKAPNMDPEAVESNGDVITFQGGMIAASEGNTPWKVYSPTGTLLKQWTSTYGPSMAVGKGGYIYALKSQDYLAKVDPNTGKVLVSLPTGLGDSYATVAAAPDGAVFVGSQGGGDSPFYVQRESESAATFISRASIPTKNRCPHSRFAVCP